MTHIYYAVPLRDIGKRPERANGRRLGNRAPRPEDYSKDTGCREISASCLACPLAVCIEDLLVPVRAEVRRKFAQLKRLQGIP
jgi:hypothetical protein